MSWVHVLFGFGKFWFGCSIIGGRGYFYSLRAQCASTGIGRCAPGFSIQQFIEGVLWMSMMHPAWARWQTAATYGFQVFAQMLWPVYMPLCVLLFEHRPAAKRVEGALLLFGILLAAYTGFCFYQYPVHASVGQHHIKYDSGFPLSQKWYYGALYFLPTIVAPVMSSERVLQWLGVLFFVSYVAARMLFHYYEISVWCFFGAIISLVVLASIVRSKRAQAIPAVR